jgi:hypothetical protein
MFEVDRSIKRFHDDPDWKFASGKEANQIPFDRGGYPYTLHDLGGRDLYAFRGWVGGYPALLVHALAHRRGSKYPPEFSLAVLTLPFKYPDTAVTSQGLARTYRIHEHAPYTRGGGPVGLLPGSWPDPEVHWQSSVPEFGLALATPEVQRLTLEADCGWRLADRHLIGWTGGKCSFDHLLTMAKQLRRISDAFSLEAQRWRTPVV